MVEPQFKPFSPEKHLVLRVSKAFRAVFYVSSHATLGFGFAMVINYKDPHSFTLDIFSTLNRPLVPLDTAFWDKLGGSGWVPESQRGYVKGKASDVSSSYSNNIVVTWSNESNA